MSNALDIENPHALIHYLQNTGRIAPTETPTIRILAGGVSNRTVYVQRPSGEEWVLKQALAKLRVAVDWFSSPERIHREASGLHWLARLAPPGTITPFIFEDATHHVLAMQAVPQPHTNWKTLLLAGEIAPDHIEQFGRLLGSIHRRAYDHQEEIAGVFADTSFFETLRLEPYYSYTASQVPEATEFIARLIDDTRAQRLTLVHGDYSPKNILVYDGRLILLDHEVIHFGDPAFDLGFSLTHLLSKAHHLRLYRQDFAQAAQSYWNIYCQTIGDVPWQPELEHRVVRHTIGCMLARVAGRSPLEYLAADERTRQRLALLDCIQPIPASIPILIEHFLERINYYEQH